MSRSPCRFSRRAAALALFLAGLAGACAPKTAVMPAAPVALRHPEFLYPVVDSGTPMPLADRIEAGWRYLQSDSLRDAEREFEAALKAPPSFVAAATGLGYVELARREEKDAIAHFDVALKTEASYVPALVGRGQALLELNRDSDALASFEAALKVDPTLKNLQSRVDLLRFRALQDSLGRASAATDAARWEDARDAYRQAIAASPESAFLYRDLGIVERRAGETAAAMEQFRKALMLDPNDARAHFQIGLILEERGDTAGALAALERASSIDPAEVPDDIITRVRERAALEKLPPEYRAIPDSPTVTRAEIAALIGVRLAPLLSRARPRQVVITDVRRHWAQQWITEVVRAGIMDIQPNHTFQPAARVRRADLATTASRVLALIESTNPVLATSLEGARPKIEDVATGHLSYRAVSRAVAAGILPLENGAFQLLRGVTGAEAVVVISKLEALAKL